jgi:hypothetical protein
MAGKPIENPWFKERFQNEAAALQLLRSQAKIPVPGLRSWGEDSEGSLFLETDLVPESNSEGWGMSAGCRTSILSMERRLAKSAANAPT